MLKRYKDEHQNMMFNINTFAFGYNADSKLMHELSDEGNGTFNFLNGFSFHIFVVIVSLLRQCCNLRNLSPD